MLAGLNKLCFPGGKKYSRSCKQDELGPHKLAAENEVLMHHSCAQQTAVSNFSLGAKVEPIWPVAKNERGNPLQVRNRGLLL